MKSLQKIVRQSDVAKTSFSELAALQPQLVLAFGSVTVCAQCAARRGITEDSLLPGAGIAGTATFVEQALAPDARVLVY